MTDSKRALLTTNPPCTMRATFHNCFGYAALLLAMLLINQACTPDAPVTPEPAIPAPTGPEPDTQVITSFTYQLDDSIVTASWSYVDSNGQFVTSGYRDTFSINKVIKVDTTRSISGERICTARGETFQWGMNRYGNGFYGESLAAFPGQMAWINPRQDSIRIEVFNQLGNTGSGGYSLYGHRL